MGGRRQILLTLVAILSASFSLRIGITEVGPLLDDIRANTGMSATLAGALGSIPFACMAVFGFAGLPMVLRFGPRRLIAASLVLLGAGTALRAAMPSGTLVVLATVPVGVGMALAGLALPGVIKVGFPRSTATAMGAYVAALSVGAALAALLIVPLAHALGGWRAAFALSAIPTFLAIPLWLLLPPREGEAPAGLAGEAPSGLAGEAPPGLTGEAPPGRPLGEHRPALRMLAPPPHTLPLALAFGLQSMCFASMINWIASLYHHAGWSVGAAAFTTALCSILTVPAALVIPALSDRGDRGRWLMTSTVLMAIGLAGLAFVPTTAAWVWIVAFGIGNGALFPLTLTLPQDLAENERDRAELTAWTLGLGYVVSAGGPLFIGALHDATGAFVLPIALLGAIGSLSGVFGARAYWRRNSRRLLSRRIPASSESSSPVSSIVANVRAGSQNG